METLFFFLQKQIRWLLGVAAENSGVKGHVCIINLGSVTGLLGSDAKREGFFYSLENMLKNDTRKNWNANWWAEFSHSDDVFHRFCFPNS